MSIDHYAVMGNPIAHSKSPMIHAAFALQTAQSMQYDLLLVDTESDQFAAAVSHFQAHGGKGLNITVPFKQAAWELADIRQPRAEKAGAVNTLWFDEQGRRIGDNTDGIGLVRDLSQNHGFAFEQKKILILGAGGAVRGVLQPILQQHPACCVIANRTVEKAQALATLFQDDGNVTASSYSALQGQLFDLIINGTSAGLQGELPPLPADILAPQGWGYDMVYGNAPTVFVQWAEQHGAAKALDGLGMLVEQAAEAFYLWRGVLPKTPHIIDKLREEIHREASKPLAASASNGEIGGPKGLEPTRYGDWEKAGRCIDF